MTASTAITEKVRELVDAADWHDLKLGLKTTAVVCTLPSGFEIVGTSACIDPDLYDHEKGVALARRRVIDRLFELHGYYMHALVAEENVR